MIEAKIGQPITKFSHFSDKRLILWEHGGIIEEEARPEPLILISPNPMIAIVSPFNALFTYRTSHCFVYNHRFRRRNYLQRHL
jgi:hypothetical protein